MIYCFDIIKICLFIFNYLTNFQNFTIKNLYNMELIIYINIIYNNFLMEINKNLFYKIEILI